MIARLADRLAFVATIIVFGAAIFVLMREFGDVSPQEVLARLSAMPARRIAAALGLTAASYLLLTGYDYLALRYARHRLPFCDVMFASFTAFALSNNVGFQILSGGSVRYRIYSRLGLQAVAIGEVVAFCSFAYALGVITIGGVLALYNVGEFAGVLHLPRPLVVVAGMGLLALSFGYVAIAALWRQPIAIRGYRLRPPSLSLAVAQLMLASADALLAATVMYVLLPPDLELSLRVLSGHLYNCGDGVDLQPVAGRARRVRVGRHDSDGAVVESRGARRIRRLPSDLLHPAADGGDGLVGRAEDAAALERFGAGFSFRLRL